MNSSNLKIYCVTNKKVNFISKPEYKLSWVGNDERRPSIAYPLSDSFRSIPWGQSNDESGCIDRLRKYELCEGLSSLRPKPESSGWDWLRPPKERRRNRPRLLRPRSGDKDQWWTP